jgi:hypothetical protein
LSAASGEVGATVFGFALPLLDVRVAADPWPAMGAGAMAGAAVGVVVSLARSLFGGLPGDSAARRGFVGWRA